MLVIGSLQRAGMLSGSSVPMYPGTDKRLKALGRMGAATVSIETRRTPLWVQLIIAAAGLVIVPLLCVVVYLLVMVSIGLSGLFTFVPAISLHALLR